jgi:hypothetical protein
LGINERYIEAKSNLEEMQEINKTAVLNQFFMNAVWAYVVSVLAIIDLLLQLDGDWPTTTPTLRIDRRAGTSREGNHRR